jgi:hypothetical protein
LNDIQLDDALQRFLHDPLSQLVRMLPDFLFDLLKGKVNDDEFYEISTRTLKLSFDNLNGMGYKRWTLLSLLKLLYADDLFQVGVERASFHDYVANATYTLRKPSPLPETAKHIRNKYSSEVCFAVPDWIIHSGKVNAFVSSISKMSRPGAIATDKNPRRDWSRYLDLNILDGDMSLLYLSSDLNDISLVADQLYLCRPDILLITRISANWDDKDREDIIAANQALNPALGTYVISKLPIPVKDDDFASQRCHLMNIDFDQTRLEPIIDTLAKHPLTTV